MLLSLVNDNQGTIAETLRGRILRGLRADTLERGERLQSARELSTEFGVDHRLILAVYRQLADEGLVEVRERGGVYVAASSGGTSESSRTMPISWIIDTYAEAYARETAPTDVAEQMRRSIETVRLNAVVISSTDDQVSGLARELREDFGLSVEGFTASALAGPALHTAAIKRANLLIATAATFDAAAELGERFGKPVIPIDVRPDLVVGEWAMLLRQPVWAIVATPEFGAMLKRFFANVRGIENLHVLVHGRDDLDAIPEGAPVYVTQRVREALAVTATKGRLLPAARTISLASARKILDFIVRANLRAVAVVNVADDTASSRA